jgi:hypothetical protein
MSATLRVTREGVGIELRRGKFDVVVDGASAGALEARNDSVEIPIDPGNHALRIQAGRYGSPTRRFEAEDHEIVNFRTRGAVVWPLYVASIVKPDLAIALKRD